MSYDLIPNEITVRCPYCGESFTTLADPSEDQQSYTEDCFVCCRPILLTITFNDEGVESVNAERES